MAKLVLEVSEKVDRQEVAQCSNGGVLGVVKLDPAQFGGRDTIFAVVYDASFKDPKRLKGTGGKDSTGRVWTRDRTGGAQLQRGVGRFATGMTVPDPKCPHRVTLDASHEDADVRQVPVTLPASTDGML